MVHIIDFISSTIYKVRIFLYNILLKISYVVIEKLVIILSSNLFLETILKQRFFFCPHNLIIHCWTDTSATREKLDQKVDCKNQID